MASVDLNIPGHIPNFIDGQERPAEGGATFGKLDPATGRELCRVSQSGAPDIAAAVSAARRAQPVWGEATPVHRGDMLRSLALALRDCHEEISRIVHQETGKSLKDARGETTAAVEMGLFVAGDGRRFYGRTTTSATPNKSAMTVRQPLGVAGLIIAANTPIANVAWKAFPALLCGNAAIMKASEDTPVTAWAFGVLAQAAGVPAGAYNTVHGFGEEAGAPIVEHQDIAVVSFTGSCDVGRWIAATCGRRMAKVCLELGGKNPFIVCDDADLDAAIQWALGSAFSNAGQRCASGSRLLVFEGIYDEFKSRLVQATNALKVGSGDADFYGPVINEAQLNAMLAAIERARAARDGSLLAPTLLGTVDPDAEISPAELFGLITCLYRVTGFDDAMTFADQSPFGLTAAIHTANIHRAMTFINRIKAGVASINGGTYGSEPHMPFGGLRQSGNGWREAGTEALDVYTDLKTVYINHNPNQV